MYFIHFVKDHKNWIIHEIMYLYIGVWIFMTLNDLNVMFVSAVGIGHGVNHGHGLSPDCPFCMNRPEVIFLRDCEEFELSCHLWYGHLWCFIFLCECEFLHAGVGSLSLLGWSGCADRFCDDLIIDFSFVSSLFQNCLDVIVASVECWDVGVICQMYSVAV